jgi:substrate import-associated zinc metallohydrolase lipoprotein
MNRRIKIAVIAATMLVVLASCIKDDFTPLTTPPNGLGGETWAQDSTDKFIYDSLTVPYNIAAYYRWKPTDFNLSANVVPPDESKVIPMLKTLTNVAFPPYNVQTGSTAFLRRYLPKTFVLAGSAEYQPNGTIVLGQAEGGTRITYFQLNTFSRLKKDSAILKMIIHTMHHEFGHILHQNVLFPASYQNITGGYTGTWFNITDVNARKAGFITAYAMAAPQEDFVEMIASMLVGAQGGPTGFDNYEKLLTQAGTTTSVPYLALKAKEAVVVDYFKRVWNIDFYALQALCRNNLAGFYQ